MSGVKFKTDNIDSIVSKVNVGKSLMLRQMGEDFYRLSQPITPMKTGNMRQNVLRQVDGDTVHVTWMEDYSLFQNNPRRPMRNYTTPGTNSHFIENTIPKITDEEHISTYARMLGVH